MSKLRVIVPQTPETFTRVASECIYGSGSNVAVTAKKIRISPARLTEISRGSFAEEDYEAMLRGPNRRPKLMRGRYYSLVRFCNFFSLDLESSALACGFPPECLSYREPKLHSVSLEMIISLDELTQITDALSETCSLSLREIGTIVSRMRKNRKSSRKEK